MALSVTKVRLVTQVLKVPLVLRARLVTPVPKGQSARRDRLEIQVLRDRLEIQVPPDRLVRPVQLAHRVQ